LFNDSLFFVGVTLDFDFLFSNPSIEESYCEKLKDDDSDFQSSNLDTNIN
jgi:hypothetical protein